MINDRVPLWLQDVLTIRHQLEESFHDDAAVLCKRLLLSAVSWLVSIPNCFDSSRVVRVRAANCLHRGTNRVLRLTTYRQLRKSGGKLASRYFNMKMYKAPNLHRRSK